MPYLIDANGEVTFVNDPNKYEQLEKDNWGEGAEPVKQEVKAPESETQQQKAPKQPMPFDDLGSIAEGLIERVQGLGETKVPNSWEDIGRILKQQIKPTPERAAEIEAAKADDPTLGEELSKLPARAAQTVINSSIGFMQQTQAEGLMPTDLMRSAGLGGLLPEQPEELAKKKELIKKAVRQTGRFPTGEQLGYQKDWVGGDFLSDDSEWVKENIKPKSQLFELGSALVGSVGGAGVVRKLASNPANLGRTLRKAPKIEEFVPQEVFNEGLKTNIAQFIKLVTPKSARAAAARSLKGVVGATPDVLEDLILLSPNVPDPTPKQIEHYEKIKQALTPSELVALTELMLIEDDSEFDYEYQRKMDLLFGAGALFGLKGATALGKAAFDSALVKNVVNGARKVLRRTAGGMGTADAYSETLKELSEPAYSAFKQSIDVDVAQQIDEKLGLATSRYNFQVGRDIPDIAAKVRTASDDYLTQQQALAPELEKLAQEVSQQAEVRTAQADIRGRLDQLKKELTVKDIDQALQKQAMLMKRLDEYARQMRKDPEWINKSSGTGKRATKNKSKVTKAQTAFNKINELVDLFGEVGATDLEQTERISQFVTVEAQNLELINNFQNALLEIQEQLGKTNEIFNERAGLVDADVARQMRAGVDIADIEEDSLLQSQAYVLQSQLNDLMLEAQEAINFQQVTPEYITDWVQRIEDLHDTAITEGVSPIPLKADATGVEEVLDELPVQAEGALPPRKPFPEENPVPITADETGNPILDADEINRRIFQAGSEPPQTNTPQNPTGDYLKGVQEDLRAHLDPEGSAKAIDELADDIDNVINDWGERLEQDRIKGTDRADRAFDIFRASNALKYSPDVSDAALLKAVNDRIASNPHAKDIAVKALLELAPFVDDTNGTRQLAYLVEQGKINNENVKKLHHISTQLSLLQANTRNAMIAINNFQKISNGMEIEGLDKKGAIAIAMKDIRLLFANVKAVKPLAQQYGLGLRLFRRDLIPEFAAKIGIDKEQALANDWNRRLLGLGDVDDYAAMASEAAQKAEKSFDEMFGGVYKKIEKGQKLDDEELATALNLIDQVRTTNGNWEAIRDIEISKGKAISKILGSAILSSPGGPPGILFQAGLDAPTRLASRYIIDGFITAPTARFVGNDALSESASKQARMYRLWLKNYLGGLMAARKDMYNKFLFPSNHPDYNPTKSSLMYEQAVLDDLGADAFNIRTPFKTWEISRKDNEKVFDVLNKMRVFYKGVHDVFIPGEFYRDIPMRKEDGKISKTGLLVKGLGLPMTVAQAAGKGVKSYYPGGKQRNLTFVQRSLSFADDYMTTALGISWHKAQIEMKLADDLAEGKITRSQYKPLLKQMLRERDEKIFEPQKVGLDQVTVGYKIRDELFEGVKNQINLTSELTGGAATLEEAIKVLKNSDDPAVAGVATYLMPVVSSFMNQLGQSLKRATGIAAAQAVLDAPRLGAKAAIKNLPDEVFAGLRKVAPDVVKSAEEFESKLRSTDPVIRGRATEALGLTLAWHAMAASLVWSGDHEITGPLSNTYRQAGAYVDPFTMKLNVPVIGDYEIPYLYLGTFGLTLATHVLIRDLSNFAKEGSLTSFIPFAVAVQANQFMDAPLMAGPDKLNSALAKAAEGDITPMQRLLADGIAKLGNPYLGYTKAAGATLFGLGKPADPLGRYEVRKYYKKDKDAPEGPSIQGTFEGLLDTGLGLIGYAAEYSGIAPLIDQIVNTAKGTPELMKASRKAMPFGKPGEMVQYSKLPQFAYPIAALTGRFLPQPSDLTDPINDAVQRHLLMPPDKDLFINEGIALNDSVINNFHWFMNEDAIIASDHYPGVVHYGFYSYLKELINLPDYKNLEKAVGPFEGPGFERRDNKQTEFLRGRVRKKLNLVKWQWVNGKNQIPDPKTGELRPQRWMAEPDLRELLRSEAPN